MVKTTWIECPICHEGAMQCEQLNEPDEDLFLINCVNHGCPSNIPIDKKANQMTEQKQQNKYRELAKKINTHKNAPAWLGSGGYRSVLMCNVETILQALEGMADLQEMLPDIIKRLDKYGENDDFIESLKQRIEI